LLSSHGEVLSKRYTDSRVIVHCRIPERAMGYLRGASADIRPHRRTAGESNGNGHPIAPGGVVVDRESAAQAPQNGTSGSLHE
jgi:hypothetical protein